MKDKIETGAAGKPGEAARAATAKNAGGGAGASGQAGEANRVLTSAGVASLLKSEFAETPGGSAAGKEVQPGAAAGETPKNVDSEKLIVDSPEARAEREADGKDGKDGRDGAREDARPPEEAEQAETELQERAEAAGRTVEEQRAAEEAEAGAAEGAAEVPQALAEAIQEWETAGGGELPPALQGLVDGRINKLTARAKSAETRVAELEAELTDAKAAGGAAERGADGVPDEKTFQAQYSTAKTFVKEVRAYLEDVATDAEKAKVERYMESERLDARSLKRRMLEVGDWLTEEAPALRQAVQTAGQQRQAFTEQERVATAKAEAHFPWLKDKDSPQYRDAQEVLKSVPDLVKRTPLHKLVMGVYVLGLQQARKLYPETFVAPGTARNGNDGKNGKNGVRPGKAPAKTPAAGGAAPPKPRAAGNGEEEAARTEFNKRPTAEGVAQLLKIGLRS